MQYYKIIKDRVFIGAINSNNFSRYQAVNHMFTSATPDTAEFATFAHKVYHAAWMRPIPSGVETTYEVAEIIEITKDKYDVFKVAIENNEVIEGSDEEPVSPSPAISPEEEIGVDFILESKLNEMSRACRQAIESGFDLELRGEIKHFSLTTQDQLNLMSLSVMAQTQSLIPYHADGEETDFYTSEEINQIVEAANTLKIQHTTYYNALKTYINALETIEDISAITYGVQIPDEYKSDVLKVLEQ